MCHRTSPLRSSILLAALAFATASAVEPEELMVDELVEFSVPENPLGSTDGPWLGPVKCDQTGYPSAEDMAKTPGHVVVRYAIDDRGRVVDISILESVPAGYYDDMITKYLTDCVLEPPTDVREYRTEKIHIGRDT